MEVLTAYTHFFGPVNTQLRRVPAPSKLLHHRRSATGTDCSIGQMPQLETTLVLQGDERDVLLDETVGLH